MPLIQIHYHTSLPTLYSQAHPFFADTLLLSTLTPRTPDSTHKTSNQIQLATLSPSQNTHTLKTISNTPKPTITPSSKSIITPHSQPFTAKLTVFADTLLLSTLTPRTPDSTHKTSDQIQPATLSPSQNTHTLKTISNTPKPTITPSSKSLTTPPPSLDLFSSTYSDPRKSFAT